MRKLTALIFLVTAGINLNAQLRLPALFADHMVIQQQSSVPIWGWANPVQEVRITVSWDTTTITTKANNATFWKTKIQSPPAGGPHTITIRAGNESATLTDVLSGEVWLCSGQSNMEWSMAASADGKELIDNISDPTIRLFHVPKSAASTPQVRGEGTWRIANQESVRGFSAVGYFFGKKLNTDLNVPVGLINASWGGTPAEDWLPEDLVESNPKLKASASLLIDDKPWCPYIPGVTYNAMISPLLPFRIAGALWYQGESNTVAPSTYKLLMETLILDWRTEFNSEFPFYYVQIAPFSGYGDVEIGTLIREQEVEMLKIPNTGMVVISDLVDDVADIHPKFKKPVGDRLANLALTDTYGKSGIESHCPVYKSMNVEKNKIRISFEYVTKGLITKGGDATEFLVAGDDQKFYPANVKIDGNTVLVSAKEVKSPVAVRFGWSNGSIPNLFSSGGLPVSCFRTDDWKIELP